MLTQNENKKNNKIKFETKNKTQNLAENRKEKINGYVLAMCESTRQQINKTRFYNNQLLFVWITNIHTCSAHIRSAIRNSMFKDRHDNSYVNQLGYHKHSPKWLAKLALWWRLIVVPSPAIFSVYRRQFSMQLPHVSPYAIRKHTNKFDER